jgi:hypothetical protein
MDWKFLVVFFTLIAIFVDLIAPSIRSLLLSIETNPTILAWLGFIFVVIQVRIYMRQTKIQQKQAEISDKQATIAHQDYLQTHRPKLRVRNIVVKRDMFVPKRYVHGQFYVDNVGGTNATVIESHCEMLWNVNGLPMERPYEGQGEGHEVNYPLRRGTIIKGSQGVTATFDTYPVVYPDIAPPGLDGKNRAYFMGWIEYNDDNGSIHRTAFCREFKQIDGSARFYPTNDPDYEHEG